MSLPYSTIVDTLDFAFEGQPFVQVTSKTNQSTKTLDFAFEGQPFVGADFSANYAVDLTYTVVTVLTTDSQQTSKNLNYTVSANATLSKALSLSKTLSYTASASLVLTGIPVVRDLDYTATASLTLTTVIGRNVDLSYTATATLDTSAEGGPTIYEVDFSTRLSVLSAYQSDFSNRNSVKAAYISNFGTQLDTLTQSLAPVTNYTHVNNPYHPSIISAGAYITEQENPDVDDPTEFCLLIGFHDTSLIFPGSATPCRMNAFSFTLDYGGGNWLVNTLIPIADFESACLQTVTLAGFKATIYGKGLNFSSSSVGYKFRGSFTAKELNKDFSALINARTALKRMRLNGSNETSTTTSHTVIQAISALAGAEVLWGIPDTVLTDYVYQEGLPGIQAMRSLAEGAGGQLRWNGDLSYKVLYPDQASGQFVIPDCNLILPGIDIDCECDLSSYILGSKRVLGSQNYVKDIGIVELPTGNEADVPPEGTPPQVQLLTKVSKLMTDEDPDMIYDLPFNYDKVYIQTLVPATGSTGGENLVDIKNFVTKDPQQYFEYNNSGFGDELIFVSNIGGVFQPQVKLNYKVLPVSGSNTTIDNGNFSLSLYYTTKPLQGPNVDKIKDQETAKNNELQNRIPKFIKQCTYTFQVAFFGALPLPGMSIDMDLGDITVHLPNCTEGFTTVTVSGFHLKGIIESVGYSFPGFLSITTGTYRRILIYNEREIDITP